MPTHKPRMVFPGLTRASLAGACAASLLVLAMASPAAAQTGAALLLEPFPKEQAIDARADALFLEQGHTEGDDEDFSLNVYETRGRVRLKPGELTSPRVGWELEWLDLDTAAEGLPERLVDQSVGVGCPIAKWDDWIIGMSLGVGYAGDGPFGDGDAWYGKATVAAFKQLSETSAIVLVLDYDGNRTFLPDVPVPGFAYTGRLRDDLLFTIVLPVSSVEWTPNENFRARVAFSVPDDVSAEVSYNLDNGLGLYARGELRRYAFYLDGLEENHDRLIFQQRRAEAGIRWEPNKNAALFAAVGYAWGGEFSTGFDARDTDEVADVSDEPYVKVGVEIRF